MHLCTEIVMQLITLIAKESHSQFYPKFFSQGGLKTSSVIVCPR